MMKRLLLLAGGLFIAFVAWYYQSHPLGSRVKMRDSVFLVELAITPRERERGLSGRQSLDPNSGMLFLFGNEAVYHFWMRGMQFPLDFIWIDDNIIVDIDENVPAPMGNEEPIELAPKVPVDKVLELNAGVVSALGVKTGDQI